MTQFDLVGKLLAFIYCFIHCITQHLVSDNCFSSVADVISSIPQGSVLGPILFSYLWHCDVDVVSMCCGNTTVELFADDLKLYGIYNMLTVDGYLSLQ